LPSLSLEPKALIPVAREINSISQDLLNVEKKKKKKRRRRRRKKKAKERLAGNHKRK